MMQDQQNHPDNENEEEQIHENEVEVEREGFNGDEEDFMNGYAPMDPNRQGKLGLNYIL